MAAAKKSAKRSAGKRPTAKKKGSGRTSAKAVRSKTKKPARTATSLRRSARKGLGAARDGFDSVLEAGSKTWRTLKKSTALMMEGVKETLAGEPETGPRRRRRG